MEIICILLRDNIAYQKPKTLLPKGKLQQTQVLAGSLWTLDTEADGGPYYLKGVKDTSKLTLSLRSLDDELTECRCQGSDIARLTHEQCELLRPISTHSERYKVFQDEPWMKEGLKIRIGNVVYLINFTGIPDKALGVVRYKGPVTSLPGIYFGVELSSVGFQVISFIFYYCFFLPYKYMHKNECTEYASHTLNPSKHISLFWNFLELGTSEFQFYCFIQ